MIRALLVFMLVGCGCGSRPNHATTDARATDGASSDGAHQDGSILDASTGPYVCAPLADFGNACCVFGDSCASGYYCLYNYQDDQELDTMGPSQGAGECHLPSQGSASVTWLASGAACNVNAVTVNATTDPLCAPGYWCAYSASTNISNNYAGICRQLCDPLDQAAHGCAAGTCKGMEWCAGSAISQWPNCPSAANTHLGYCS